MGLSPIQLLEKFLGEIFRIWSEKNSLWWSGVFIGGFAVLVCFVVVNRGEFVVECVANMVS
jgi:hypothetical protein